MKETKGLRDRETKGRVVGQSANFMNRHSGFRLIRIEGESEKLINRICQDLI